MIFKNGVLTAEVIVKEGANFHKCSGGTAQEAPSKKISTTTKNCEVTSTTLRQIYGSSRAHLEGGISLYTTLLKGGGDTLMKSFRFLFKMTLVLSFNFQKRKKGRPCTFTTFTAQQLTAPLLAIPLHKIY